MEQRKTYLTALTIAGSDSGGGAGIQADLKTFSSLGLYGTSVITAITAQNTQHVRGVEVMSPEIVRMQFESIVSDISVHAVKTGMLPTPQIIEVVAQMMDTHSLPHLVVDPVMVSTSGSALASAGIIPTFRKLLFPRLTLLTPNIPEASVLSGVEINVQSDMYRAANVLISEGCRAVLMKGGHMRGEQAVDMLFTREKNEPTVFPAPFISTFNLHGTGCTLSAAIASFLAQGYDLEPAVEKAKQYITEAILAGRNVKTGRGNNGPLNHLFNPQPMIYEDDK